MNFIYVILGLGILLMIIGQYFTSYKFIRTVYMEKSNIFIIIGGLLVVISIIAHTLKF